MQLPGGWVGLPFAAAISALGALVWLRRRRRHRYLPLSEYDLDAGDQALDDDGDDDLQPLPAVVDRMRRAVREHAPQLLEPGPPHPTVAEYTRDPAAYQPPPVGPTGLDLAGLTDLARPGGLGLTGPGADAAARALLVAVLSSGAPSDPDAQGRLVIPALTLKRLLGADADHLGDLARLDVARDANEALDLLDQAHLERRRVLDDHGVDDASTLRADPTAPPMPQLVLLADAPTEDLRDRLAALLNQGHPTGLTAVLLGQWPPGATANVDSDGRTTLDHQTVRVAVLDEPTAADLLGVITEAEADHDEPPPLVEHAPPPARSHDGDDSTTPAVDATDKVQIRVFGKVAVLDGEGQLVPGLRQHAAGLLVYLAVHRKGADKNDILEAIWPDAPLRRAAERLSTEVGNLRRCIRLVATDQKAPASRQHRRPLPPQPRRRRRRPLAIRRRRAPRRLHDRPRRPPSEAERDRHFPRRGRGQRPRLPLARTRP